MEMIIGLAALWGFFWLISAVAKTTSAAAKTVSGKGSFSDNIDLQFKGMQPLEVRLVDVQPEGSGTEPLVKRIEARGLLPVRRATKIAFMTSVFDATEDGLKPMLSVIEALQEPTNAVFQHIQEVGIIEPDQGFVSWVTVGAVIPEFIQPPHSGGKTIVVFVRLIDESNPPNIRHGFEEDDDNAGILWAKRLEFKYTFTEKGYLEAIEHEDEARALAVQLGVAIAMADGSLGQEEGNTLKNWIARTIEVFGEEVRIRLAKIYNDAMKSSYADAKKGELSLSKITSRINEIADKRLKYEAIELCFDVMAADGVADASEMKVIKSVAEALELDFEEIEKLRDTKIIGLDASVSAASIEELLGIEPSWDSKHIKQHLRSEFQKWNNRINTLAEGEERDNAQRMLDAVSEARKKYV
jgi:tellurite resistance protein